MTVSSIFEFQLSFSRLDAIQSMVILNESRATNHYTDTAQRQKTGQVSENKKLQKSL